MVMKFSHSFPQNGKIMLKFVFLDIGHKRFQWLKEQQKSCQIQLMEKYDMRKSTKKKITLKMQQDL